MKGRQLRSRSGRAWRPKVEGVTLSTRASEAESLSVDSAHARGAAAAAARAGDRRQDQREAAEPDRQAGTRTASSISATCWRPSSRGAEAGGAEDAEPKGSRGRAPRRAKGRLPSISTAGGIDKSDVEPYRDLAGKGAPPERAQGSRPAPLR